MSAYSIHDLSIVGSLQNLIEAEWLDAGGEVARFPDPLAFGKEWLVVRWRLLKMPSFHHPHAGPTKNCSLSKVFKKR